MCSRFVIESSELSASLTFVFFCLQEFYVLFQVNLMRESETLRYHVKLDPRASTGENTHRAACDQTDDAPSSGTPRSWSAFDPAAVTGTVHVKNVPAGCKPDAIIACFKKSVPFFAFSTTSFSLRNLQEFWPLPINYRH
jgi:hypothetical protein